MQRGKVEIGTGKGIFLVYGVSQLIVTRIVDSILHLMKQIVFFFKISSLVAELEALKKEKSETEEAKKTAEEQIEAMRKEHEEKVNSHNVY